MGVHVVHVGLVVSKPAVFLKKKWLHLNLHLTRHLLLLVFQ